MKVNGREQPRNGLETVLALLESLGHDPQRVAVEKNGQIVPRASFRQEALCEDDAIEIVCFVGGG